QTSACKGWCSIPDWSSLGFLLLLGFITGRLLSCGGFQPGQHRRAVLLALLVLFSFWCVLLRLGAALHVQQGVQFGQTGGFFSQFRFFGERLFHFHLRSVPLLVQSLQLALGAG